MMFLTPQSYTVKISAIYIFYKESGIDTSFYRILDSGAILVEQDNTPPIPSVLLDKRRAQST